MQNIKVKTANADWHIAGQLKENGRAVALQLDPEQHYNFPFGRINSRIVRLEGRGRNARFCLTLSKRWQEGFLTYNDLAVGFPLGKAAYEQLLLEGGDGDQAEAAEGTWHHLAPYGNCCAFTCSGRRALALIHRGASERIRFHIGNHAGRHFSLELDTRARETDRIHDAYELIWYQPLSTRLWWQEALEYSSHTGVNQITFRIAVHKLTDAAFANLYILGRTGRKTGITVRRRGRITTADRMGDIQSMKGVERRLDAPVCRLPLAAPGQRSGLYEIRVTSGLAERRTFFIKKPEQNANGDILFVFATNSWRSYALNGHYHDLHNFPWSYSYSATLMEGISDIWDDVPSRFRYPMQPRYYNNTPNGYMRLTAGLVDALEQYSERNDLRIDYCGEEDVDDRSVRLDHYRCVILDNHAEYSTNRELKAFERYRRQGGAFLVLGGDAFGRRVDYIRGDQGEIRYQVLFKSAIIGDYPDSAQYTHAQRLKRSGICYAGSPTYLAKQWIRVTDIAHPVTSVYQMGEVISEARWEVDETAPDWRKLAVIAHPRTAGRECAALAFDPTGRYGYFGPMGISEILAGYYGHRDRVAALFERVLDYLLAGSRIGKRR
ncbi:MAG: hypothetical protein PHW60_10235 [Kiritimatiellae bacterium]|nr:hypothetical protein [Kiritimatiellia bacterium]